MLYECLTEAYSVPDAFIVADTLCNNSSVLRAKRRVQTVAIFIICLPSIKCLIFLKNSYISEDGGERHPCAAKKSSSSRLQVLGAYLRRN
jgi:hypothetical protein